MARGYASSLLFLSALWGASYLFIKVAVEEIEPAPMIVLRLVLAFLLLAAVLVARLGRAEAGRALRASGRHGLVLGLLNAALPFWLIAWGEKHIDSGVAAVANATVPLFVALLAIRFQPSERSTGLRLVGLLVGFLGVAALVGVGPAGGWLAIAGTLAVVAASISYACSNLYTQARAGGVSPLVISTAVCGWGALLLLPPALFQLPEHTPSAEALGSVAALGLGGTAIAYIVLYRMISGYGASRTTLVTYLLPAFALFYGAVFLGEAITVGALLGLALILAGVALGSGVVRSVRRRRPLPAAPLP